jgi:hypothetical protein
MLSASTFDAVIVELMACCDCCKSWAGNFCQWVQEETVDGKTHEIARNETKCDEDDARESVVHSHDVAEFEQTALYKASYETIPLSQVLAWIMYSRALV